MSLAPQRGCAPARSEPAHLGRRSGGSGLRWNALHDPGGLVRLMHHQRGCTGRRLLRRPPPVVMARACEAHPSRPSGPLRRSQDGALDRLRASQPQPSSGPLPPRLKGMKPEGGLTILGKGAGAPASTTPPPRKREHTP